MSAQGGNFLDVIIVGLFVVVVLFGTRNRRNFSHDLAVLIAAALFGFLLALRSFDLLWPAFFIGFGIGAVSMGGILVSFVLRGKARVEKRREKRAASLETKIGDYIARLRDAGSYPEIVAQARRWEGAESFKNDDLLVIAYLRDDPHRVPSNY